MALELPSAARFALPKQRPGAVARFAAHCDNRGAAAQATEPLQH
jgi:hypothetical protein